MNSLNNGLEHGGGEGSTEGLTTTARVLKAVAPPKKTAARRSRGKEDHKYPVEPRTIVVIKKPRTIMNHSYRDFSIVPAELDWEPPTSLEEMTFSQKVHDILSKEEYAPYVGWMPHGRSFKIFIPKIFEEQICGVYFGHSRYSSFLRLLNNYGFKHITQGSDRNCYYHEAFLRGMPHLCKYMPRPKNARRLIPDPENEPNFYRISQLFPLPDDQQQHPEEEEDQGSLEQPLEQAQPEPPQEEPVVNFGHHGIGSSLADSTDMQRLLLEQQQTQQQQQQQRMLDLAASSLPGSGSLQAVGNTLGGAAGMASSGGGPGLELALRRQQLMNQLQQQQSTTAALLETLQGTPPQVSFKEVGDQTLAASVAARSPRFSPGSKMKKNMTIAVVRMKNGQMMTCPDPTRGYRPDVVMQTKCV
eukprot:CAMPEP_0194033434 /NCGR_PEP_ID=MMETSP0009_2-20130614/6133_1 /TAXON_ID=210454 /ORGANISM="Grammatophora oceanica, Strain CCMP 410" /LENGTH=414 /DNA_ID=CAMNT_0038674129 /DNA_START=103 /DNA_END=1348 /DNA_ORIENTATION=+